MTRWSPWKGPIAPTPQRDAGSLLLVAMGAFILFFGYCSHIIRGRLFIPSSVWSTTFGILLGPKGAGLISTFGGRFVDGKEGEEARYFLLQGSRIVLGIQVTSAGLELPSRYLSYRKNAASFTTLLFPTMTCSWLITSTIIYMILPCSWSESLIIGATLAPTDPILAGSVIKGHFASRHVSESIRETLLAESGANDGLGSPFLYLALSLLFSTYNHPPEGAPTSAGGLIAQFLISVLLYNVLLSIILGVVTGWSLRRLLEVCKDHGWIDEESMLCFSLAVSVFLVGVASMLDTNQLLCCFVAGIMMNWKKGMGELIRTPFAEGVDNILDIVIFTVLGASLPFNVWNDDEASGEIWRLIGVATLVILFRRLPPVLLFSKGLKSINSIGQTLFVGWFGPIGIGALYYALEATEKIPGETQLHDRIYSTVTFVIFVSVYVHGLSIPAFLLATAFFPNLAPALLGKNSKVKQDFISQHQTSGEDGENNERQPLLPS